MADSRQRTLGFASCALASALWGCGFYFGKIALDEMNVGAMVFYRFCFACVVLLPVLVTHKPGLNRREWWVLMAASFFGVPLQFLCQFYGLSLTSVAHASLMVGMLPVLLAVAAAVWAHERMDAIGWVALAASTGGAVLIALGAGPSLAGHRVDQASLAGDLVVILSLVISLVWILLNKQLMEKHSAIVVTAYGLFAGTAMLGAILLGSAAIPGGWGLPPVHRVSAAAWGSLAASGVLCTAVTTLLWNWGLTKVPASQAGILLNMEPLIGSLLGVFALGEVLGPRAWVGGGLILLAAVTLTMHSKTVIRANLE